MRQVPTPSQTQEARQAIADLHALFPTGSVELKADYDGDLYLSWPVGFADSIEVETYSTSRETYFTFTFRAWDRTGGLSREKELCETSELDLVKPIVEVILKMTAERQAKIETAMSNLTDEGDK